ncbi:hypothetical protein XH84_31295 [Bradyrhizobium nanningense]|nr:hypothetical protein XH84_31295 [Bradyrhizobium nanningense]
MARAVSGTWLAISVELQLAVFQQAIELPDVVARKCAISGLGKLRRQYLSGILLTIALFGSSLRHVLVVSQGVV